MPLLILGLLTYLTISTVIMLAMARAACREAPTPPPMAEQDKGVVVQRNRKVG
jgi:hypothetical protein